MSTQSVDIVATSTHSTPPQGPRRSRAPGGCLARHPLGYRFLNALTSLRIGKYKITIPPPPPTNGMSLGTWVAYYDRGETIADYYAGTFIGGGGISVGSYLYAPISNPTFTDFASPPPLPVGASGVAFFAEEPDVLTLDAGITTAPQGPIPGEIDLRDEPEVVEVVVSWAEWAAAGNSIPDDFGSYVHASDYPGLIPGAGDSIVISTGEPPVSIFDDIYGIADDLLGGWLPGGPVSPFDPPTILPIGGVLAPPTILPPTVLPPPVGVPVVTSSTCSTGPSPVWKKVCGVYKWVYPKRRRRKALVTKQDAQGLATLKGIVGVGKTMDTWIATHS